MTRPQIGALALVGLLVAMIGSTGCNNKGSTTDGDKKLTISVPDVSLTRSGTKDIKVKITREKFNEDVKVDFSDLPPGVTVETADKTIKKDQTEGTFTFKATGEAAEVSNHTAKATATGGTTTPASTTFKVSVSKS